MNNNIKFKCDLCPMVIETLEEGQVQWHLYRRGDIGRLELCHNDCARPDCECGCSLYSFLSKRGLGDFDDIMAHSDIRDIAGYNRLIEKRKCYREAYDQQVPTIID